MLYPVDNVSARRPLIPALDSVQGAHPHVSYIEQTRLLSGPLVTVAHAEVGILDRHGEAGKRDHLSPMLEM